jgi:hypothetical protein
MGFLSDEETQCKAEWKREAATWIADAERSNRESDSSIVYDGGAIFGQPQERKPGFAAGSQGPERVGKVGAKVRRVARTCSTRTGKRTGRRSSRARARRRARRSRRAAVNGQGAATSTGAPSPAGGA